MRNFEHKKMEKTYVEMIKWVEFLNHYPRFRMNDDNMKPIQNSFKFMNQMPSIMEKAEQKLKGERLEIENALMDQLRRFDQKIKDSKAGVEEFKDKLMPKQATLFNE